MRTSRFCNTVIFIGYAHCLLIGKPTIFFSQSFGAGKSKGLNNSQRCAGNH